MLYLQQGEPAQAEAALRQAQADFDAQTLVVKVPVYDAIIRFAMSRQNYRQAVETSTEYIEYLHKFHTTYPLADCLYLKGRALLESGHALEAQAEFLEAHRVATEMGARRLEWQILAALSDIAALRGETGQAADLRHQAREIVGFIAVHTPPALQDSCLNQPEVQALHVRP